MCNVSCCYSITVFLARSVSITYMVAHGGHERQFVDLKTQVLSLRVYIMLKINLQLFSHCLHKLFHEHSSHPMESYQFFSSRWVQNIHWWSQILREDYNPGRMWKGCKTTGPFHSQRSGWYVPPKHEICGSAGRLPSILQLELPPLRINWTEER